MGMKQELGLGVGVDHCAGCHLLPASQKPGTSLLHPPSSAFSSGILQELQAPLQPWGK